MNEVRESIKMLIANPEVIAWNTSEKIQRKDVYEAINSDITLLELRIEDLDRTRKNQIVIEESESAKFIRTECLAKIDALVHLFQAIEKL